MKAKATRNHWRSGRARLLVLLAIVPFIPGCASIDPDEMVPKPPVQSAAPGAAMSLRVMDVTGPERERKFGGAAFITDEQFKKALLLSLAQSHVFSEVSSAAGDLDLFAVIMSQDQRVSRGVLQYTATMTVTYKLMDRAGKVVWSASYDSEYSSVAFSGASRTVDAREGSARENLAAFIQGLRVDWLKK